MMKWIILLGTAVFMAGCCCTTSVTTYRPVVYKPVARCGVVMGCRNVAVMPVAVAPVVEPVLMYPYGDGPIDVTTTTIDYY